jgi:hypothetical protein
LTQLAPPKPARAKADVDPGGARTTNQWKDRGGFETCSVDWQRDWSRITNPNPESRIIDDSSLIADEPRGFDDSRIRDLIGD